MSYQLFVCGSRTFDNYEAMKRLLDFCLETNGEPELIVHGGAHGADSLASRYGYERQIDLHIEGAKWGSFGKAAGRARNARMVSMLMPHDKVFAFVDKPLAQSRGTNHMVTLCQDAGFAPCIGVFLER